MPARALIVLLLILNLGVALWWATRGDPAPAPQAPALPAGAERLRLLDEPPAPAPPAPGAPASARPSGDGAPQASASQAASPAADPLLRPAPPDPSPAAGSPRCHRFGPFADTAALERAAAALRPGVQRLALRETRPTARGWDVRMTGLPDRAAAEAMAARLATAGFGDHYLLPADADGRVDIALGRFGSEDGAQRHRAALQAAGFDVVASPIGGQARHWIHAALAARADPAALQRAAGAAQAAAVDCASLEAPAG